MTSTRECLPWRRRSFTQKVHVGRGKESVFLTCGLYADGRLGEIFIDMAKQGSAVRTWMGQTAMLFSVALQHGTPLETLVRLFLNTSSEPSGKVEGHARITKCASVMDYVARALAIDFLGREDLADVPADAPEASAGVPAPSLNGNGHAAVPVPVVAGLDGSTGRSSTVAGWKAPPSGETGGAS